MYLFLDPARWLPAGGRCAIFPPPPSPSRSLSPPLLLLSFTLGWGWGGSLVVSKNIPPPRLFLDPDFPDFSHFLHCVHRWSIYPIAGAILHSQQQGEKLSAVAVVHHMLQLIVDLAGILAGMHSTVVSLLTRLCSSMATQIPFRLSKGRGLHKLNQYTWRSAGGAMFRKIGSSLRLGCRS